MVPPPPADRRAGQQRQSVRQALRLRYVPILDPLLLAIYVALPFLWVIAVVRRGTSETIAANAREAAIAMLVATLLGGLALARAVADTGSRMIGWTFSLFGLSAATFERVAALGPVLFVPRSLGIGAASLVVAVGSILWPFTVSRWESNAAAGLRSSVSVAAPVPLRFWAVTVALGGSVVLAWVARASVNAPPLGSAIVHPRDVALTFTPSLLAGCGWLASVFVAGWSVALWAPLLATLLFAVQLTDRITAGTALHAPLVAALTLPLMIGLARATIPAVSSQLLRTWWRTAGRAKRVLAVLGFVLGILLLLRQQSGSGSGASLWTPALLVWSAGDALILVSAWMLLRILRRSADELTSSTELPSAVRDVGAGLALIAAMPASRDWLVIGIALTLGYFAWQRGALVKPRPQTRGVRALSDTISEVIAFRSLARSAPAFRKEVLARVAKGELSPADYEEKVRQFDAAVNSRREALGGIETVSRTLADEAPSTAWARATAGMRAAALLGAPWIALAVGNVMRQDAPLTGADWVALLGAVVRGATQWVLHGALIGYFFPFLRGRNGLEKGFTVFAALIVPTVVITAFSVMGNPGAGVRLLALALQLFVHCVLLGLVIGDYAAVRRAGLGWRHLLEFHGLGAVAGWGSSLLVAIGAAVTTLVATGTTSLLTMSVRALFPELQVPPSPVGR
jgi:hypothetical protein